MSALIPDIKWAQRKARLFITIAIQDVENQKIELEPSGRLKFYGESHGTPYSFDLELFKEVIVEESKWNLKGRNIVLNIAKKDQEDEYWPRLTKDKTKNPHIQIDWAKWIDEDDENEAEAPGGDWDPSAMQDFNMGGMGGMGGMEGGDSDDEEEEEEEKKEEEAKPKADLNDLDAEEEAPAKKE